MKPLLPAFVVFLFFPNFVHFTFAQNFQAVDIGEATQAIERSNGVAWIDYDNDDDLDLFITSEGGVNSLFRNDGQLTFVKVSGGDIAKHTGSSRGCTWGDYNNDGLIDLFVANGHPEGNQENSLYKNLGDGFFKRITDAGTICTDNFRSSACSWADYDNDGWLDLFVTNYSQTNSLYHNNGDETFTAITGVDPVLDICQSNGFIWTDYDNDNDLDLLVSCRREDNNSLFVNNGDGTFTRDDDSVISNDGSFSQGFCSGDVDHDSNLDLFLSTDGETVNKLYFNDFGFFMELFGGSLTNDPLNSYGSTWLDLDNDGDLDLFVINAANRHNALYYNLGLFIFERETSDENILSTSLSSMGTAAGDPDNDGDLDIFVANGATAQKNEFYTNETTGANWVKFQLEGTESNRSAIGSKVYIKAGVNGQTFWQMHEISGQTTRYGQNSLEAFFGLGDAEIVDSVKIWWPSGNRCAFSDMTVNTIHQIKEPCIKTTDTSKPEEPGNLRIYPNPAYKKFFVDFSGGGSTHPVSIELYDTALRLVHIQTSTITDGEPITVDVVHLAQGAYIVKISSNSLTHTEKIVLIDK